MQDSGKQGTNGHAKVSAEEIRGRYFGVKYCSDNAAQRISSGTTTFDSQTPSFHDHLTPSAKHIVSEARKRIGERRAFQHLSSPDERELFQLVAHVEEMEGEALCERERTAVVAALSASLEDFDILTPLLEREGVNDIIVRSYQDISVQIGRKNIQTDLRFPDRESYSSFVENLLKRAGKSCTLATPVVDAALGPDVRICVTHESFSPNGSGPMLTVRISRHRHVTLDGLVLSELAPRIVLEYLSALVRSGQATILIAGEVGTGKTTLVRALASKIKEDEAVLIIEDTHEIVLQRQFTRTLLTREANTEGAGRISPSLAIRTGMRMAMNRIILGEMRDAETAEAFVDVCASGHSGMSTIHARNARDALLRLELFLLRAQGNVGLETVRRQIANAISAVVYLGLDPLSGSRRILNVLEVGSAADGAIQLSAMFSHSNISGVPEWLRESGVSSFPAALKDAAVHLPFPGVRIGLGAEDGLSAMREMKCKG